MDGISYVHHHTKVESEWQELRNRYPENRGHWPPKSTLDCPELACGSCPSTLQSPACISDGLPLASMLKRECPCVCVDGGLRQWILQYA